jgi:general secretion pathway protein M
MNWRLTPTHQRIAAVGLLVVLLGLFYLVLVSPVVALYREYHEDIAAEEELVVRYERVAGKGKQIERQLAQIDRQISGQERGYLKGNTRSLAAAEMQEHVKRVVESNGGRLNSIQILPGKEDEQDQSAPVSLKVQMTGSTETVQKVFYHLESGLPRLFLDQVYLRGRAGYQFRAGRPQADELDIRFTLQGYLPATTPKAG